MNQNANTEAQAFMALDLFQTLDKSQFWRIFGAVAAVTYGAAAAGLLAIYRKEILLPVTNAWKRAMTMKKMEEIGSDLNFYRRFSLSNEHTTTSDERPATQGQNIRPPPRAGSALAPGKDPSSRHSPQSSRVEVVESSSFITGEDLVATQAHAHGPGNLSASSRSRASRSPLRLSR